MRRTLEQLGIDPQRVQMFNLSSSMGPRFAEIAGQMTDETQKLGPSPLNGKMKLVA